MIVEDQLDGGVGRIGGVAELEEFDEFTRAVAVLNDGVHVAGYQIDAGQQRHRPVGAVFMIIDRGQRLLAHRVRAAGPGLRRPRR